MTACTPIILYGTEILGMNNRSVLAKISKTYDRVWMKIFSTFDLQIIRQCQFYTGNLPLSYQIDFKRICFLNKFVHHSNSELRELYKCFPEHTDLNGKYSLGYNDSWFLIKLKMRRHFENTIQ